VQGVLTTAQAVGPVPAVSIGLTFGLYLTVYAVLLLAYIAALYRLACKGSGATKLPGNAPIPQVA